MSREAVGVGRAFQPWYARPKLPRQTPDPDLEKEYSMHLRLVGIDCATQDAKIGVAFGNLRNGTIHRVELHWYEAHGIGRKKLKIKEYLD